MPKSSLEVQKLKIALTSSCCLSCLHCGVDKSLGHRVTLSAARCAVRALMSSAGQAKRLELYGGEPFLEFGRLSKIVSMALGSAARSGKLLSVSVASNGLLLRKKHLEYLRDNNINLSISFSGRAATHDHSRVFPGGAGSFSAVKAVLPSLFSALGPYGMVALDCVHPDNAADVAADFRALVRAGFRVINVECVHGPAWPRLALKAFEKGMEEISGMVEQYIRRGVFVYPEPLLELARCSRVDAALLACPFYRDLELYPDGSYSFYPYAFIDYGKDLGRVRIGSAAGGFVKRFSSCSPGGEGCRSCVSSYYRLPGLSEGSFAYAVRERSFRRLFTRILSRAGRKGPFRDYTAGLFALLKRSYSSGPEAAI